MMRDVMTATQQWLLFATITLCCLLTYYLAPVLMPFVAAALIAYLCAPLVDIVERCKLGRTVAVVLVFVGVILLLLCLMFFLIPLVQRQLLTLINKIPAIIVWCQQVLLPKLKYYFNIDIDLQSLDISSIKSQLTQHWREATQVVTGLIRWMSASTFAFIAVCLNLLLIPVITFYLLRDWRKLLVSLQGLLPRKVEPLVSQLAGECDMVISAFLRGQLIVMILLGLYYSFALMLLGLDIALVIGCMSGLLSIVPYLGFIVGIGAALLASLFQFYDVTHVLWVVVIFMGGQLMESFILTPILIGDRIGLHPIAVIFAIMAGGELLGFVGILLALPIAAIIMILLRHLHYNYKKSIFYLKR